MGRIIVRISMPRETLCQDSLSLVECEVIYTESSCNKAQCLCIMRPFEMEHLGVQKPGSHLCALATVIFEYRLQEREPKWSLLTSQFKKRSKKINCFFLGGFQGKRENKEYLQFVMSEKFFLDVVFSKSSL